MSFPTTLMIHVRTHMPFRVFLNNPHTFILITVVFLQKSDWLLIEFLKFKVRIRKSKMWTKGGETKMNE